MEAQRLREGGAGCFRLSRWVPLHGRVLMTITFFQFILFLKILPFYFRHISFHFLPRKWNCWRTRPFLPAVLPEAMLPVTTKDTFPGHRSAPGSPALPFPPGSLHSGVTTAPGHHSRELLVGGWEPKEVTSWRVPALPLLQALL